MQWGADPEPGQTHILDIPSTHHTLPHIFRFDAVDVRLGEGHAQRVEEQVFKRVGLLLATVVLVLLFALWRGIFLHAAVERVQTVVESTGVMGVRGRQGECVRGACEGWW